MTESTRPPPGFPLLAVAALVALTVIVWVIGLAWAPALLVSGALVALLGLRRTPDTNADEDWPALPEGDADQGARREVARLSWALQGQAAQVEHRSLLRLRAVADHRLGLRGLHLAVPAEAAGCAQLLGLRAHRILTSDRHAVVTFDDFAISLDAVERLNDGGPRWGP